MKIFKKSELALLSLSCLKNILRDLEGHGRSDICPCLPQARNFAKESCHASAILFPEIQPRSDAQQIYRPCPCRSNLPTEILIERVKQAIEEMES